jgi:hypothetical protein
LNENFDHAEYRQITFLHGADRVDLASPHSRLLRAPVLIGSSPDRW